MAKYFITFTLLAILAFETNSIYSRVQARSPYAGNSAELETVPHNLNHHPNQLQPTHSYHNHYHKRKHHPKHHNRVGQLHQQDPSPNDEEDAEAALRRYMHMQRHMQGQSEHQKQHHKLMEQKKAYVAPLDLRTAPRLWQHLQQTDSTMSADQPLYKREKNDDDNDEDDDDDDDDEMPPVFPNYVLENSSEEEEEAFESQEAAKESLKSLEKTNIEVINSLNSNEQNGHQGKPPPTGCPKCESDRHVAHVTEEELTTLRIDFVKQQILEKLRLKERPNVSAVSLPKPIYEGTTIEHVDEESKSKELDDYYARTSKKFIFFKREYHECQRVSAQPSICFSFKIDDADADGFDVSTAVLWIFKNKQRKHRKQNNTMFEQQTIVVSEVQQQLNSKYLPIVKAIAMQRVDVQDEWMKIDIVWPTKRWFGNHELSHLIHISCQSCEINSMEEMISVDKDYRPFIMVDIQNRRLPSRQKRSINCTNGVSECCREKLYISFDDIGWGDWIIQPRGYDAYFCRGTCGTVASVTQSTTHHSSFLQKILSTRRNGRKPLELIPCCTAKQYSSLQLVFMDSNNTATQMTFPNMVVESCGCR